MNGHKFKWVLYTILMVIIATIAIQIYWNYKNYTINKQQLINDVQVSLDNAVEAYYADLAQNETQGLFYDSRLDSLNPTVNDSLTYKLQISGTTFLTDSLNIELEDIGDLVTLMERDSLSRQIHILGDSSTFREIRPPHRLFNLDSSTHYNFRTLTSRVIVSLTNDSLQLRRIDSLFKVQLANKNISINYGLKYIGFDNSTAAINESSISNMALQVQSKSPYIHAGFSLIAFFDNPTLIILRRILLGILLSCLLALSVIGCLIYLLKIIKHQKQLAEVKNDLISNITHEFKTPIATIGVALESIKDFNVIEDREKTKSYLDMSHSQLNKLNTMVEKLLETATLDSEKIELNKERLDLKTLLTQIIERHQLASNGKSICFETELDECLLEIDAFHFDNAVNNVIDNAIKYGGDNITITLSNQNGKALIAISDDGNTLNHSHKEKIFEKFYRVQKGNQHDVKGFGIGLYYTKAIIENHNGHIDLLLKDHLTTFKIEIPSA